jgi:hypothetical protein
MYFITLWEDAIINECDWHLGLPCEVPNYAFMKLNTNSIDWDWYLDTPDGGGSFLKSPIWDPESGFGDSGVSSVKTTTAKSSSALAKNAQVLRCLLVSVLEEEIVSAMDH